MQYREVKYQLVGDYSITLSAVFRPFIPLAGIDTKWIALTPAGVLTLRDGWANDGPSGPTVDTPDSIRGASVHDALYWMIRHGHLPRECRHLADLEFHRILLQSGMSHERARVWYEGVEHFAASAIELSADIPVLTAP